MRVVSSNERFAPNNVNTIELLKQKHPPPHPLSFIPTTPVPDSCSSANLTSDDIIKSIMSFPAGSAGSPDGLRPQHLKDLISVRDGPESVLLVESITHQIRKLCLQWESIAWLQQDCTFLELLWGYIDPLL